MLRSKGGEAVFGGLYEISLKPSGCVVFFRSKGHFPKLSLGKATWNMVAKYIDIWGKMSLGFCFIAQIIFS